MGKGKSHIWASLAVGPLGSDRWVMGLFLFFLASLGGAAAFTLFQDGKDWVLLMALAVGAALWGLERLPALRNQLAKTFHDCVCSGFAGDIL